MDIGNKAVAVTVVAAADEGLAVCIAFFVVWRRQQRTRASKVRREGKEE
jgi:hypothetical protein